MRRPHPSICDVRATICLSLTFFFAISFTTATFANSPLSGAYQTILSSDHTPPRPNIIFILTDDQDVHLNSLEYMPFVKKHLIDEGTYYNKHYCTTAVCCPSRVTLWTGKAAHNTNITDVNPPYGGYPKFVTQGFNENYLPVWLQEAGYNTYYTGKLFNVHTVSNYDKPFAKGFTTSDFLLDPYTYNYLNSTFRHTGEYPRSYEGQYVTDVMAEKAYSLLDEAVLAASFEEERKPFFLTIAPSAPHADIQMTGSILDPDAVFTFDAPVSAERHKHLFKDEKVKRTPNFNPDKPSGAAWLLGLPQQNRTVVDWNDHFYRQRLRALQAVDELVDRLFERLNGYDILDNTYIVYSSDNGFHIGQHRLQPGKSCGYEEDINIPLIIRGPGVAKGESTDIVTTHTDLAPTFLELLGIPLREDLDGSPIPVTEEEIRSNQEKRREHVAVEYWGFAGGEGIYGRKLHENNTYKAIRILGPGYNLYYSIWCTNEHELYDMDTDPGQLHNLLSSDHSSHPSNIFISGTPLHRIIPRLDTLLFVLKSCTGTVCQRPWDSLHPNGEINTLSDALHHRYDKFYEEQVRVEYKWCENGYIPEAEGAMWENQGNVWRGGLRWDEWV